jgi:hypothetical protein
MFRIGHRGIHRDFPWAGQAIIVHELEWLADMLGKTVAMPERRRNRPVAVRVVEGVQETVG